MSEQALKGVKVLELCSLVAGPFCAKLLADMGAEVVKVEPPIAGDEARRRGPFYRDRPDPEGSLLFIYLNTNKRSVTLDPGSPTGRELLLELIKRVDILVEDRPYALLEEQGLDYRSLHKANRGLIVTSVTPFGRSGPYRDYKSHYMNTYHAGGDGYLLPGGRLADALFPDRAPLNAGGYLGEYQVGLSAVVATMGALMGRMLDGQGMHVDVSKQEALINLNSADFCRVPDTGVAWSRVDRHLEHYLGGLFRCKDGFWEFLVQGERQWKGFLEVMGNPAWADDERFLTHEARAGDYRWEIEDKIEEWALEHTRDEIYHGLQKAGVAAGPVYSVKEVLEDEQLRDRRFFVDAEHPHIGKFKMPSAAHRFSHTPWAISRPAPSLGEHNEEIYREWLGYSGDQLAKLSQAGVI